MTPTTGRLVLMLQLEMKIAWTWFMHLFVELMERLTWTNVQLLVSKWRYSILENARDRNYSVSKCVQRKISLFVKEEKLTKTFVMLFAMGVRLMIFMNVALIVDIAIKNINQLRSVVVHRFMNQSVELMGNSITIIVIWPAMDVNKILLQLNVD